MTFCGFGKIQYYAQAYLKGDLRKMVFSLTVLFFHNRMWKGFHQYYMQLQMLCGTVKPVFKDVPSGISNVSLHISQGWQNIYIYMYQYLILAVQDTQMPHTGTNSLLQTAHTCVYTSGCPDSLKEQSWTEKGQVGRMALDKAVK